MMDVVGSPLTDCWQEVEWFCYKKNKMFIVDKKRGNKPLRKYLEGSTHVSCKNFFGYSLGVKIINAKG